MLRVGICGSDRRRIMATKRRGRDQGGMAAVRRGIAHDDVNRRVRTCVESLVGTSQHGYDGNRQTQPQPGILDPQDAEPAALPNCGER